MSTSLSLKNSPYSAPFHTLFYLGAWSSRRLSQNTLVVYAFYQMGAAFLSICGILSLFSDLYLVSDNFVKIIWNLCITTLFAGAVVKNIHLYVHHHIINDLRVQLHRAEKERTSPEDQAIQERAAKSFVYIRRSIFVVFVTLVPVWLVTKYQSSYTGEKSLPVPMRLPTFIYAEDDGSFDLAFLLVTLGATLGLLFIIEISMTMYAFLIQISREYEILLKDVPKLNDLYENCCSVENGNSGKVSQTAVEINKDLRKRKTELLVKQLASRQNKLIEYTKGFETCYNKILLLEFFVVSVVILVSAILCLLASETSFYDLSYFLGYLAALTFHTFVVCWYATRIQDQCYNVGVAAYSTNWYLMDLDIQKDINMIILRAQNPPRLTAGRAMDLNVNTFMNVMKNIYSWLTLFRQLEIR
ncbi:hypothetical protein RUM43_010468 [Polyplax serrata]|uniref:Odorant receptor n=1 Tax=Polyplax serrata TaxID=468196 RepID=A0AAN8S9Z8_POLSC